MEHANRQSVGPGLTGDDSSKVVCPARMVIHFAVLPGQTVSLRLGADSEVRVGATRIWLTRIYAPYDYAIQPGDVIRLQRGERVWFSCACNEAADVTLTSEYVERRRASSRWVARWRELLFDLAAVRSR